MPVPPNDVVCRFIDPIHWIKRDKCPNETAFKPPKEKHLSVWHEGLLQEHNVSVHDLKIEGLSEHGHVCHSVRTYLEVAQEASQDKPKQPRATRIQVEVEFRPEEEFVDLPWRKWDYAHCQVEATVGPQRLTGRFRKLMAARSKHAIPPPVFAESA